MPEMSGDRRVLVLFAHPALERSRANRHLVERLRTLEGVTFRDLYELYPEFDVQAAAEQKVWEAHDVVVLQHPLYWYSVPALLKQYLDIVLELGWAYGTGGDALAGKYILEAVTTGGSADAYTPEGLHEATLDEMLAPMRQTARLCHMTWLPPFAVHGTHRLDDDALAAAAETYRDALAAIADGSLDLSGAEDAFPWRRPASSTPEEATHA